MSTTTTILRKTITEPDEVRLVDKGRIEIIELADLMFTRTVFQPGWRWSESVKPIAKTDSCEFLHKLHIQSGSMCVRMDDGTEMELTAGDVAIVPLGHDAWVTSTEPVVGIDFGADDADYALPRD